MAHGKQGQLGRQLAWSLWRLSLTWPLDVWSSKLVCWQGHQGNPTRSSRLQDPGLWLHRKPEASWATTPLVSSLCYTPWGYRFPHTPLGWGGRPSHPSLQIVLYLTREVSRTPFSSHSYPTTLPTQSLWLLDLLPAIAMDMLPHRLLTLLGLSGMSAFVRQTHWGPTRRPALGQPWVSPGSCQQLLQLIPMSLFML